MKDKTLDHLLEQLSQVEVNVGMKAVTLARQKVDKKQEKKVLIKEYAPIVLGLLMSTILTLLSGCIGFFFIRDTKAVITLVMSLLGMTQIPILVFLVTILYFKEKNNHEKI